MERHTNSNCLECLAHGNVCFEALCRSKQAVAAQRLLFVFGVFLHQTCATVNRTTSKQQHLYST